MHGCTRTGLEGLSGAAEREGAASVEFFFFLSTRGNCDSLFLLSVLLVCAAGLALLSLSNPQTGRGAGA